MGAFLNEHADAVGVQVDNEGKGGYAAVAGHVGDEDHVDDLCSEGDEGGSR